MQVTVHAKQVAISSRMRLAIEAHIHRVFRRQRTQITDCVVAIAPDVGSGNERVKCSIRLWSPRLGVVVVSDVGETTRTAVQQAAIRTREVVRRRLHKRRARVRRRSQRERRLQVPAAA